MDKERELLNDLKKKAAWEPKQNKYFKMNAFIHRGNRTTKKSQFQMLFCPKI
jgi:hypothetical protein